MITTSQKYKQFIVKSGRHFIVKLVIGNQEFTKLSNLKIKGGTNSSDEITFGDTVSTYIEVVLKEVPKNSILKGKKAILYIGLELEDASYEWIKVGTFNLEKPIRSNDDVKITAYDNFSLCNKGFFSDLKGSQKISSILNEQCDKIGISYVGGADDVSYNVDLLQGLTIREAIGILSAYCGKNAVMDANGNLKFVWYADTGLEISASRFADPLDIDEEDTYINRLDCAIDDDTTISVGTGIGIYFSCPGMTKERLNVLYNRVKGFTYRSAKLNWRMAQPDIEAGDIVTVVDKSGNRYIVPFMEYEFSCDGGYFGTIESKGKTEQQKENEFKGPISTQIERTYTELISTKKLVADTIEVYEGKFETIDTNYINVNKKLTANEIEVNNIKGDYAGFKVTVTDDLTAIHAQIGSIDAETIQAAFGKITIMESEVSKIGTIINRVTTSDSIHSLLINAETAVIDTGFFKSIVSQSITAGDLMAGDISTTKFKLKSDSGNFSIVDNTIQIKDTSRVRVQVGKDASGDYNIYVWDKLGKLMFDATGVTGDGIQKPIIRDDMVSASANISGDKINITSVINKINANSTLIESSHIKYDGKTLDVAFNSLNTTIDGMVETIETQSTQINASNGKISTLITDTTQIKKDVATVQNGLVTVSGNISTLQTNYSSLKQTVDGLSSTVGSHTSSITTITTTANDAKSLAGTANTNASTALSTANTAKTTADGANTKATTAQTDATTAKNSASTANTNANTALSTANTAKNTADTAKTTAEDKSKTFIATPTTPYKKGDLWVQGTTGNIMRCIVSRASGAYVATDWEKADKYTDDTKANAVDARITTEIKTVTDKQSTFQQTLDSITSRVTKTETNITTVTSTANTANTNASAAKTDASNALSKANTAVTDATTAKNNASSAVTTANTASTNASSALTKANTAISDASTAKTNAANAVNTANTAKTTADSALLKSEVEVLGTNNKKFKNVCGTGGTTASMKGFLVIVTPIVPSKMVNIHVRGYNYLTGNETIDLSIGFYAYISNQFLNNGFINNGSFPINSVQACNVSSTDTRTVVVIGDANTVWQYPQLVVDEVIVGYQASPDSWKDGFSMSIMATLPATYTTLTKINGTDLKKEITTTKSEVAEHTVKIGQITSRVEKTESSITTINGKVTSLETWKSNAELKITDSAIISTVTKSSNWTTLNNTANAAKTTADDIKSKYASKTDLSNAKSEAIASANTNTTTLLKSYMTTEQTKTAINQANDSIKLSVDQSTNLLLNFDSNMFNDCVQSIKKNASDTTVKKLQNMPIGIAISTLQNRDICISVDVVANNAVPKSLGGYAGALFTVTYTDNTTKTYKCVFVPGAIYLQNTLSGVTKSINTRLYATYKIDNKAIKSVSMLSLEINCKGDIQVSNPKVEFGVYPSGIEFSQKEQELRLQKTELLLTPTEITALVNERIGANGELKTMRFVLNKDGGEFYDGCLSIYNKLKQKVFYADTNGDLVINNLTANNGKFSGLISASTISGGTITGTIINGATITTTNDIVVGNNINLNPNDSSYKNIRFSSNSFISNYMSSGANSFNINCDYKVEIYTSKNNGHATLTCTRGSDYSSIQSMVSHAGKISIFSVHTDFITANKNITIASDRRFKTNILEIDLSELIDNVDIKSFEYIYGGGKQIGVIAQDLLYNKFHDYIVNQNPDGYYSVNYNAINMALVQKVQKMDKLLRNMMGKISYLECRLQNIN